MASPPSLRADALHLLCHARCPPAGELFSDTLQFPSPVSSSDALVRDETGRLSYHYAIVNLAAVPEVRLTAGQWHKGERRGPACLA